MGKSHKVNVYKGHVISRPNIGTGDFYRNCVWNIGGPSIEMDFCFPESQLDIEIDGFFHTQPAQMDKDLIREIRLKECHWFLTRIPDQFVINVMSPMLERKQVVFK
jgi:very-short-patch-repair endonuclease